MEGSQHDLYEAAECGLHQWATHDLRRRAGSGIVFDGAPVRVSYVKAGGDGRIDPAPAKHGEETDRLPQREYDSFYRRWMT
jgi:hypothetical protein